MDILYSMLALTLIYSTPIIITAIGGMFSERSGVANIALEGMMMIGGFTAATTIVFLEGTTSFAPWMSLMIGALAGGLISVIHAYLSIHLSSDQIISGTAINILAGGLTIYLSQIIFGQQRTATFRQGFIKRTYSGLSEIPIIGKIFFTNMYPTVFLAFALVILSWYILYKTPFGLRLRATGEHPHAVDSMGISVYKMRYIGVIVSGCLAGLGGGVMVLTQDTQFTIMSIHGTGFIALAALIFGKWRPLGLLSASLFFGFSQILSIYSTSIGFLSKLPMEYFKALPYIFTIVALVVFSNKAVGPKAVGEPYDKGQR
ncbi:MAG: sugar ABC transporter permease [Firmicutes bacterium HGW-Firmicutes-2]|nr:MAG: sugar ABC transporter permease [Firmicutes bacterium HGW-Firmicutes-2]